MIKLGKHGEWAKTQSKFLSVGRGEKMNVRWTGKSVLSRGPYGEGWDFDFVTDFGTKTWTCRNSKIIAQFDDYKEGEALTIARNQEGEKPAWAVYKQGEEAPF